MVQVINNNISYVDFCDEFAQSNKFRLIGNGYFSKVYGRKKKKNVYKIGKVEECHLSDPYLFFINKVKALNNPFFPKVENIQVLNNSDNNEKYYLIEIEKLIPCYFDNLKEDCQEVYHNLLYLFNSRKASNIEKKWNKYIDYYKTIDNMEVYELFNILKNLLKSFDNDLHSNNMMIRENGQLVIIDPICPKGMETPY